MKLISIHLILTTFLYGALFAQDTEPAQSKEPPPGPLIVKFAPDYAQWTVTTQHDASPFPGSGNQPQGTADPVTPSAHHPPTQVTTVVKTGNIRHVTIDRGNGLSSDVIWDQADNFMMMRPGWNVPILSPAGSSGDLVRIIDFSQSDFTGFNWLSSHNFTGIKIVAGRSCLTFQDTVVAAVGAPPQPMLAIIDLKTRYPVSLQIDRDISTYAFGPAPTDKLSLPPEYAALLKNYQHRMQAIGTPPARP